MITTCHPHPKWETLPSAYCDYCGALFCCACHGVGAGRKIWVKYRCCPQCKAKLPSLVKITHIVTANLRRGDRSKNTLTKKQWIDILFRSQGKCFYCKNHFGINNLVLEHRIAITHGGATAIENVVAACGKCNFQKGRKKQWTPPNLESAAQNLA